MSRDLFELLSEATLAGTAAILLVLMLRRLMRSWFGAGAAYALWSVVPFALVAIALPATVRPAPPASPTTAAAAVADLAIPASMPTVAFDLHLLLAVVWVLGMAGACWRLLAQQRRFVAGLGALRLRDDGLLQSETTAGLPAVVGWRARIVLPADFERRYEPGQQQLVLCHEQVHQRRGDLWVNGFASLLRCVFWFNPLMQVAAIRFRNDQELACDAAVLKRFPRQRRAYGDALLKTQLAVHPLPVGCHWFGPHPMKERIAMLKHPLPSRLRWSAGLALVLALTLAGGWTAWAAQPARIASSATAAHDELALTMKVGFGGEGEKVESLNVPAGEVRRFHYQHDGAAWTIELTLTPRPDGTVYAKADIIRDGVSQGQPKLVFKPETGAAIRIGREEGEAGFQGIAIELNVSQPSAKSVDVTGDGVSAREAAIRVAAKAGLQLANPELLADDDTISFRFDDMPARTALQIIAEQAGLTLRIDDGRVHFDTLAAVN